MAFVITADSTPVEDGWGWADYWTCADWVEWHKQLKAVHGPDESKRIWVAAWEAQSVDANPYNWCKYDSVATSYLKSNGIDIGNIVSRLTNTVSTLSKTADTTATVSADTANKLKFLIPIVILILLVLALLFIYKKAGFSFLKFNV